VIVIGVTNRVYRYAARRLGWAGVNPVSLMLSKERPKPSQGQRRRVFEAGELEQTIAAADEPYRTLFTVAALTGARLSELLGLTWAKVNIDHVDDAQIEFACQVDRSGKLSPTKTDGSARTVPIPRQLAQILAEHKQRRDTPGRATSCSRRAPAARSGSATSLALYAAPSSRPRTAPANQPSRCSTPATAAVIRCRYPHGAVPSMHSFRHTVASRALLAGESVDEVAFLLGHRDANVTRAVYLRELSDARRRRMRRSWMIAEFADVLGSEDGD
jgi:integrase